jgi:hypothetical protein
MAPYGNQVAYAAECLLVRRFGGVSVQGSALPPAGKNGRSNLKNSEKSKPSEADKYRTLNVGGMYSVYLIKKIKRSVGSLPKTEPSFEIRYSIFCGSAVRFY